jgi:hypothetical protein
MSAPPGLPDTERRTVGQFELGTATIFIDVSRRQAEDVLVKATNRFGSRVAGPKISTPRIVPAGEVLFSNSMLRFERCSYYSLAPASRAPRVKLRRYQ